MILNVTMRKLTPETDINGKDLPDVVVKGEWEETGIIAHRRFRDSMRSRIWKSPYAKLPTP